MTRVCVTWDREETARLVIRCREALAVSDETAKAAVPAFSRRWIAVSGKVRTAGTDAWVAASSQTCARHIAANDPSTRLALNGALTAVLDGIAATLGRDYESHGRDMEYALTSLAAIAEALGVQEDGNG